MLKWEDPDHTGTDHGLAIDDVTVAWTVSTGPLITGAATASAFTTTYGTASNSQSFSVSGTNLTADLVATAPTGFEVSNDGTTYGTSTTFTESSGSASGTLRVRLAASAVPGGSYNSQNVALTSAGATAVNITTSASGNTVNPKALTVTGLTGDNKTYDGTTSASATGTATVNGLVGSDTVTLGGTPVYSFDTASAGNAKTISTSGFMLSGGQSSYYTLTQPTLAADIEPRALTVTADNVTKPQGGTLTGGTGFTSFSSSGLALSQTIGSVTVSYGTGASAGDPAATYPGQVMISAATGGSFTASNYTISYVPGDIIVSASPTITTGGTLSAVDTTYGTPSSSPTSFTVSGAFLTGDLTVTAPSGFEVSTFAGSGYSSSLNLPESGGTVATTAIFVRLAAITTVGTYSGNVVVSGGSATSSNVATAASTVSTASLTITGLSGVNKSYDGSTSATLTGTPAYFGLVNGDTFSVTGTPSATFATKSVGSNKPIAVTGYTAPSTNYTVVQPTGLTANITSIALSVSGAAVVSKPYDGTAAATITGGSLEGIISPDVVTIATSTGTFVDVNAGTGIAVTGALTLGGADANNYTLSQPSGLTGTITQATQTITFGPIPSKLTTDAPFALTATGGASGQPVTYTSGTPGVATVSGSTVTIVALGSTVITASQAGNSNYAAATSVSQTLTVIPSPPNLMVVRQGNGIQTLSNAGNSVFLEQYSATTGSLIQTVAIPDSGSNAIVQSGGSTTEGALMRSPDGKVLSFPGYKTTPGGGTSGATSSSVPRVAVTVDGANVTTLAATTTQFSSNNFRSAATDGAGNFWGAGGNSGTYYLGGGTPTAIQTATPNTRVVNIFGGELYYATGSAPIGIYKFTGLPTTTSTPTLAIAGTGTSPSPYGFSFNPAGTIAYVADDRTNTSGGILRFDKPGSTWTLTYTLGTGATNIGARGITVDWSGSVPVIYATTAEGSANRLIKITDTGSGSSASTLATSGTNQIFRGVAFAPVPAITSQPTDQTVTYGSSVTFSAAASGTPSPTAQWQVSTDGGTSFSNIGGATSTTSYSFSPTVADSGKRFQVVYSNVNGNVTSSVVTLTVNPQVLDPEGITLTREEDGSFTASAGDFEDFSYSYEGTGYGASATPPTAPGLYTVIATSADPNYTGSKSLDYFIAGLIPAADSVTRTANGTGFKIPIATLLGNDNQVTSEGILTNSGLSITAVTSGTGNTVSKSGAFVFYTPATPSEGSPLNFTYTLTDGTLTADVLVTVTTVAPAPFALDILRVVTGPAYDEGEDETTVTVEFAGVPNQTYSIEYSTNMSSWTTHGPVSTGPTGTFEVTFSAEGDLTDEWGSMFFRATR